MPGRANEDAWWLGDCIGVVTDGAGVDPEFRAGCTHSVAWYSHELAARFGRALAGRTSTMAESLADAIAQVRQLHEAQCDLSAGSPSATVAAWRIDESSLECLLLCDSSILLARPDGVVHLTDNRLEQLIQSRAQARKAGTPAGDLPHLETLRNGPNGFPIAQHDPAVASQAQVHCFPLAKVSHVIAASDGATRAFDTFEIRTAGSFIADCTQGRIADLCDDVRAAERARAAATSRAGEKVHDDFTVVVQEVPT